MALTTEIIRANAATAALTDEQVSALVEMSRNDENAVIGQKTGEIYGGLDADILASSGIAKNGTEKTYDYAKRVIGEIKAQAGEAAKLQGQIADLTKEKTRLEKVIAEGGADAEVKKELSKAKADLAQVTKDYADLKTKYDTAEEKHAAELFGIKLDGEFSTATAGLKFKAGIPESVTSVVVGQTIAKVKGYNPEYIDDGKGGKVLAFSQNGAVMRNPENNLNPFTAAELIRKELDAMGVLDKGVKQTGAGSQQNAGGNGGGGTIDLSGARTQSEAHDIIVKSLVAQGKKVTNPDFQAAVNQAWKDNRDVIKGLPLQ